MAATKNITGPSAEFRIADWMYVCLAYSDFLNMSGQVIGVKDKHEAISTRHN